MPKELSRQAVACLRKLPNEKRATITHSQLYQTMLDAAEEARSLLKEIEWRLGDASLIERMVSEHDKSSLQDPASGMTGVYWRLSKLQKVMFDSLLLANGPEEAQKQIDLIRWRADDLQAQMWATKIKERPPAHVIADAALEIVRKFGSFDRSEGRAEYLGTEEAGQFLNRASAALFECHTHLFKRRAIGGSKCARLADKLGDIIVEADALKGRSEEMQASTAAAFAAVDQASVGPDYVREKTQKIERCRVAAADAAQLSEACQEMQRRLRAG